MGEIDAEKYRLHPPRDPDDLSSYRHRQLIGLVGLVLPPAVWLVAALRPLVEDGRWQALGSISAYYYSGSVSVFAGALSAMAFFLAGYRGYRNSYGLRDRIAALVAAGAALVAAFFPTEAPADALALPWWTEAMGTIHFAAGAVLFLSFAFFTLVQFPRTRPDKGELDWDKKIRNVIYYSCGVIILAGLVWAGYESFVHKDKGSIFIPETVMLEAFAFSWLVKGRAEVTAAGLGRRIAHYVSKPAKLVVDAKNVVRRQKGEVELAA